MTLPPFDDFLASVLRAIASGGEKTVRDIAPKIAAEFQLTPIDLDQRLKSGGDVFSSRVAWAASYLKAAGLAYRPRRGVIAITPRGHEFLTEYPNGFKSADLKQFPEFQEFLQPKTAKGPGLGVDAGVVSKLTPEEEIDRAYLSIRTAVTSDIQDRLLAIDPIRFERLVLDLLVKMGYGGSHEAAAEHLGKSGDGGVDGLINEDVLGLDRVFVQAKRWKDQVGRETVQAFVGSLAGQKATKGVLITTSSYSPKALEYANSIASRLVLIDGKALAGYMIDYGLGVRVTRTVDLPAVDTDYFEE